MTRVPRNTTAADVAFPETQSFRAGTFKNITHFFFTRTSYRNNIITDLGELLCTMTQR